MRRVRKQRDQGTIELRLADLIEEGFEKDHPDRIWWYDADNYLRAKHTDKDLDAKKKYDRDRRTQEAAHLGKGRTENRA